jgi:hypothetical protein
VKVGLINLCKVLFSLNVHIYIINWTVVHRQYLCNCLNIISLLVETSVPLVHETMDLSPTFTWARLINISFLRNSGYANAPHCWVIRTLPVLYDTWLLGSVTYFNCQLLTYTRVWYNERMLQRTVFINKIRMLQQTRRNTIGRHSTRLRMTCRVFPL